MVVLSYLLTNNYLKKLKLFQLLSLRSGLLVYTKETVRGFLHGDGTSSGHKQRTFRDYHWFPRNDVCETSVEISRAALLQPIGSFSIDDGNGSENVSFKMNLCRVYSNLLKMASVGEFPWS